VSAALIRKYRTLLHLRRTLAPHITAQQKHELRHLAAEFPGALRELDSLPTEELEARLLAVEGGATEPWMEWMDAYHTLMRVALECKRALAAGNAAPTGLTAEFVQKVADPRAGRLNALVFDELARRFALPAKTLWDTLFPRRGAAPRPYRD
jgi:hypothetical protein